MNHRERVLAAIRGEIPDRIPWIPRLEFWHRARLRRGDLSTELRCLSLREITERLGVGHYATVPDFRPTAIAMLPDGSFTVLERAFDMARGVRCRVMRFPLADLRPGATVQPEELARLAAPYAVDNLEGIAATRGPNWRW